MNNLQIFFVSWLAVGLIASALFKQRTAMWYLLGMSAGYLMLLPLVVKYWPKRKVVQETAVDPKEFNVENFNEWFKTEYDGYDGRKGAAGIFLRTDKLSPHMVKDYLLSLGHGSIEAEELSYKHWQDVRKDWLDKLHR